MLHDDPGRGDGLADYLFAVAVVLVVAAVVVVVAGILDATTFGTGLTAHAEAEVAARTIVNLTVVGLLLAAVVASWPVAPERARPVAIAVLVLGGAIVLFGAWSIVDILSVTVHVPGPASSGPVTVTLGSGSAKARLATLLPQAAAMAIAVVAMVGANRVGDRVLEGARGALGLSGSRGSADRPRG